MNLFGLIRESFGQHCVKKLRRLEHLEEKRARQRNHLRFNLRCRDEGIIPTSLNIKNPIPTRNAERMVQKVRMALVKERIRCTANKIKNLETETKQEMEEIKHEFHFDK